MAQRSPKPDPFVRLIRGVRAAVREGDCGGAIMALAGAIRLQPTRDVRSGRVLHAVSRQLDAACPFGLQQAARLAHNSPTLKRRR